MKLATRSGALAAAMLLTVSGCSEEAEPAGESPTIGEDPSASEEPEAAPSESPGSAAPDGEQLALDYPDVGLTYAALPEVEGAQADALATYVAYEHGLRRLSRTARISPELADAAGQSLMPTLRNTVKYLKSNDLRYAGTTTIDVTVDGGSSQTMVLDLCTDATDLRLVSKGNERPVKGLQRAKGRVTLNTVGGTSDWAVTDYTTLEEPC
ncbi:MAG: hypothetical protein WBQ50_05195 [Nocardioides sp.]